MKVNQIVKRGYTAYVISSADRETLKERFPPKFPKFYGDHVTVEYNVLPNPNANYGTMQDLEIIGYAEDAGIEALVVRINGQVRRPDGKIYHLTWSLDPVLGKVPKDSNAVISTKGHKKVPTINITGKFQHIPF